MVWLQIENTLSFDAIELSKSIDFWPLPALCKSRFRKALRCVDQGNYTQHLARYARLPSVFMESSQHSTKLACLNSHGNVWVCCALLLTGTLRFFLENNCLWYSTKILSKILLQSWTKFVCGGAGASIA